MLQIPLSFIFPHTPLWTVTQRGKTSKFLSFLSTLTATLSCHVRKSLGIVLTLTKHHYYGNRYKYTEFSSEQDFTTCKTKHGPPLVRIQFETQIGLESSVNAAFVRPCFCKGQIKAPKSVLVEKGEGKRKGRVKNTSSQCSEQGR